MLKPIIQLAPRPDGTNPAPIERSPEAPCVTPARGATSTSPESDSDEAPLWVEILIGVLVIVAVGGMALLVIRSEFL